MGIIANLAIITILASSAIRPADEASFTVVQHTFKNKQVIEIFLPPDYDGENQYPIIYFNDGDNYSGILNSLTRRYPEPFIMVGLHAGKERNNKYLPYEDQWIRDNWGKYKPRADKYSAHFIEEIIPFVEKQYSVDEDRRAIFGISLGGLHATWIALKYPRYFSFVGAISPSYWVNDYAIIGENVEELTSYNRFYFDIGTSEWDYYVPFIDRLKEADLIYGDNIFYYEVFGAAHTPSDWTQRIRVPFLLFMNGGRTSGAAAYQLAIECIPSQSNPGLHFQRINPTATFDDGITYSLTTEAKYEKLRGQGEITSDGRFIVKSEEGMLVKVSYSNWSEEVRLENCN